MSDELGQFSDFSEDSGSRANRKVSVQDILDFSSGRALSPEKLSQIKRIFRWVANIELRRVRGNYDVFLDDLCQEAAEALIEVSGEFNPERKDTFMSYLFCKMHHRVRLFLVRQMSCSGETYVGCFSELAEKSEEEEVAIFDREDEMRQMEYRLLLEKIWTHFSEEECHFMRRLYVDGCTLAEVAKESGYSTALASRRRDQLLKYMRDLLRRMYRGEGRSDIG